MPSSLRSVCLDMKFTTTLLIGAFAAVAVAKPTVYLIRHGEKPDEGNGLSEEGEQRAQCLRSVFGASSQYNIGHIMAQTPKSGETRDIMKKYPAPRHEKLTMLCL